MDKLPKPTSDDMKNLSQIRQVLVTSCYYIAINNESVGGATTEFFKTCYLKMIKKTIEEGEWFALECQHRPIFDKCDEMYKLGFPLHGK